MATVAVTGALAPAFTFKLGGLIERMSPETVTVAVFEIKVSAAEVAVTVTDESLMGGVLGAVYVVAAPLAVAVGDSEPQGGVEHDTVHVTPLFAESLETVALICCVPLACIVADAGETATLMGGGGVEWLLPQPTMPKVKTATTKTCGNDTRWKDMTDLHVLVPPAFSFPNWKRQRGARETFAVAQIAAIQLQLFAEASL